MQQDMHKKVIQPIFLYNHAAYTVLSLGLKASSVGLMLFTEHTTIMEQPQTIQHISSGTQMWAFYITSNSHYSPD